MWDLVMAVLLVVARFLRFLAAVLEDVSIAVIRLLRHVQSVVEACGRLGDPCRR